MQCSGAVVLESSNYCAVWLRQERMSSVQNVQECDATGAK